MSRRLAADDMLTFSFDNPLGVLGIDNDPRHPFARAAVKLLRTGSPIQRLGKAFVSTKPPDSELNEGDIRWLGVFVASDGGRVLFFPGTEEPLAARQSFRGGRCEWEGDFAVDHLTLESDLRSWHVTTAGSTDHRAGSRTLELGEGRFLWCSMQFQDTSIFRRVLRNSTISARVPGTDARRRTEVLRAAREGLDLPIVSAPRHPAVALAGGLLHLAFVVGPPGFERYRGEQLGWPFDSPFLKEPVPGDMRGQPVRSTRLSMDPVVDIDIHACWLRGRLSIPAVLAGQCEPWPAAKPGDA